MGGIDEFRPAVCEEVDYDFDPTAYPELKEDCENGKPNINENTIDEMNDLPQAEIDRLYNESWATIEVKEREEEMRIQGMILDGEFNG